MMDFELARLIASFCGGVLLCLSGSLVQGLTQNDLASPSTLGLNALSVLMILSGHILSLFIPNMPRAEYLSLGFAVIFAGVLFIFAFNPANKMASYGNKQDSILNRWVLWGLCFNLFAGALFSLVQFIFVSLNFSFPDQLWFGNFRYVENYSLIILILFSVFIYGRAYVLAKQFRALSFGTELALTLGVNVKNLQIWGFLLSFLAVSVVNSFFGVFAFIGLVFPHVLRSRGLFSNNFTAELRVGSLVAGLAFMGLDLFCYNFVVYGAEIPVGMVTSLLGTALLLMVLSKRRDPQNLRGL